MTQLTQTARALPGVEQLLRAAGDKAVYLVGGAVRDLLRGEEPGDLDFVVEGELGPIAAELGGAIVEHERFSTASVTIDGRELDLASARAESYERPGALPDVRPASIEQDLARRDFTFNALALALSGEPRLLDPHGGAEDLRLGVLRVLHDRSFVDDPTRALRAARYAARLELQPDDDTAALLREVDLSSVSGERVLSELALIAAEPRPSAALALAADWGLLELGSGPRLVAELERLFEADADWREFADRDTAILLAVAPGEHSAGLRARAARVARHAEPGSPAEIQVLAHDHVPEVLAMARAAGAAWLDEYVKRLRHVELEIDGYDLIAAGAPEGPAIGRGLNAALEAKLDGEIAGRDQELRVALAAASE